MAGAAMWQLLVPSLFSALPGRHVAQTGDRHGQRESHGTSQRLCLEIKIHS